MYDKNKAHYIVATAIIVKDDKYLIAKRGPNEKNFPNKWTVPGGKLELNDYIKLPKSTRNQWYNISQILLEREVVEEVGLKIKNIRYICDLVFIRPDKIPTVTLSFLADYASGKVNLCQDLTEYVWVTSRQAKKYPMIEGIHEELLMADKILRGHKINKWRKKT